MYRILIAALMAWTFSPFAARAQDAEDARSFVLYYHDLMDTGELERVAALYHPDAIDEIRRLTVAVMAEDTAGDLAFFLDVPDTAAFLALPPAEAISRILDLALEEDGVLDNNRAVTVTIGEVVPHESDFDIVHVRYHIKGEIDGEAVDRQETMSLRIWQGQWRALFSLSVLLMLDFWNEPIGWPPPGPYDS